MHVDTTTQNSVKGTLVCSIIMVAAPISGKHLEILEVIDQHQSSYIDFGYPHWVQKWSKPIYDSRSG